MERVVVAGGAGFIGHHLARALKKQGKYVRVVDIQPLEYPDCCDEYICIDLRSYDACKCAVAGMDEVYQLAADMGGMGFIESHPQEIMYNNALINLNMVKASQEEGIKKYFYSSSACVYRDMKIGEPELTEEEAYPAMPHNEYGWEKLYAERVALASDMDVRIARFQNTYGPEGTFDGGREKAPAAICRKVIKDKVVEVWGDGTAVRNYIYVDDLVSGILKLMESNLREPINIGSDEYVSVSELVEKVMKISGNKKEIRFVDGPVGVESRNFSNNKLKSLGWEPKWSLSGGLEETYKWIESQV